MLERKKMLDIKLSEIKLMEAFARKNPEVVSLSQGGLKIDESIKEIKDSLQQILHTNKPDYYGAGAGLLELREKIAKTLSLQYQVEITTNQIIVTHGCNGALTNLALLLLRDGDEVILPEPAYPSYTNLTEIAGAKPIYISSLEKETHSWKLPVEKIKEATTFKTKMIIFSNPSNPTSTVASKEDLVSLIAWCESKKIFLVVDEVYANYVFEGKFQSAVPFVKQSKYVIPVNSFSKNFALSGWRVGYMVVSEAMFDIVHAMQDSLFICPSVISQYAALAALNNPQIAERFKTYVQNNKNLVVEMLQPLKEKNLFEYQNPTAGFYIFIKTDFENTTQLCMDLVSRAGVSVVPGGAFGPSSKNYIRLCFARNRDVLEEGLARFINYWEKNV